MIDFIESEKELSGPTAIVDHFAALFFKETGMMAPGKDQPAEMISPPDVDQRAQRFAEWLQADGYKRAKEMRLAYAIDLTREAMAMCDVPFHIRDQEIELLKKQMERLQKNEPYPESLVERYWREREQNDFTWSADERDADGPSRMAPHFRREDWR